MKHSAASDNCWFLAVGDVMNLSVSSGTGPSLIPVEVTFEAPPGLHSSLCGGFLFLFFFFCDEK